MSRLAPEEILALHRELIATPSVSGEEKLIADRLTAILGHHGFGVQRLGDSLIAFAGEGPLVLFDTHVDTVPPALGWERDPYAATVEAGKVHGLGSNDAKASVAAMTAAFLALADSGEAEGITIALALVAGEETRSLGTRDVLEALAIAGRPVAAAVFGEPTGLDFAIVQKGLMVLELVARGATAHAAHARKLGGANALHGLARDLVALEGLDLGGAHPELGPTTLQPTVIRAGSARNVVPAEAVAVLDVRTIPTIAPADVVAAIRGAVAGEIRVLSDRFAPRSTPTDSTLFAAACAVRPEAHHYGSATLSDWALLAADVPAIKVGPGRSERSHTLDEFVFEEEVLEGARFYEALGRELALRRVGREAGVQNNVGVEREAEVG